MVRGAHGECAHAVGDDDARVIRLHRAAAAAAACHCAASNGQEATRIKGKARQAVPNAYARQRITQHRRCKAAPRLAKEETQPATRKAQPNGKAAASTAAALERTRRAEREIERRRLLAVIAAKRLALRQRKRPRARIRAHETVELDREACAREPTAKDETLRSANRNGSA